MVWNDLLFYTYLEVILIDWYDLLQMDWNHLPCFPCFIGCHFLSSCFFLPLQFWGQETALKESVQIPCLKLTAKATENEAETPKMKGSSPLTVSLREHTLQGDGAMPWFSGGWKLTGSSNSKVWKSNNKKLWRYGRRKGAEVNDAGYA